jgi:predicted DNA-binding protein
MDKLKTIKIKEDLHNKLKIYCKQNGLKIGYFIEKIISTHLEKDNDGNL